ncbi:D-alanyl-D-alanine carboxypeptidase [Candidatus Microgenomates bacterium]|nr:MAG: D-alanyl-D-alanine carboxypeptidase [Candidatus Microgenomates bacterium]
MKDLVNKSLLSLAKFLQRQNKKVKLNLSFICLFIIPIFLLGLLLWLILAKENVKKEAAEKKLNQLNFIVPKPSFYPKLISNIDEDGISAQAYLVIDNDSKVVLFARNPKLHFSMASTTKIMTALTALNYFKMTDVLTIKNDNVEGAVVGFKKGEKVSFESLLYAMLLPSGNDAAEAIAQNYSLGREEFIKEMNKNASSFYLKSMHFSDPTGLDDNDFTNVLDLARLGSEAKKNKILANVVSTKSRQITNANRTRSFTLNNLNKLLGVNGVNGIKTGFTDEAQGVLVTSKIEKGHDIIIVVMKSKDRFSDTQKLLSMIEGNINYLNFDY